MSTVIPTSFVPSGTLVAAAGSSRPGATMAVPPGAATAVVDSPDARAGLDVQFVVCALGEEQYGLDVSVVREIIRLPTITSLPRSEQGFSGVINLRGRIVPIVDLRERCGMPVTPPTPRSRIVVTDRGGTLVGLIVDGVSEVVRVPSSSIGPTPQLAVGQESEALAGIARTERGLVILPDLGRLLDNRAPALPSAAAAGSDDVDNSEDVANLGVAAGGLAG